MKKHVITGVAAMALVGLSLRASDVSALYEKECTKCHGADGKGDTRMGRRLGAKDYSDPKVQEALKDDAAFKAVKEGLKKDNRTLMQPLKDATDDQIKTLIAHM